jgi:hypothetical protein
MWYATKITNRSTRGKTLRSGSTPACLNQANPFELDYGLEPFWTLLRLMPKTR